MEDQLFEMVRKVVTSREEDSPNYQPEELTSECLIIAQLMSVVFLNKKLKKKLTNKTVMDNKLFPIMCLACLWGLHTYLKQLAMGGVYVSPSTYTDKEKIKKSRKTALRMASRPLDVDRVAEAVMDRFVDSMLPALKQTGVKISKNYYKLMLEVNLKWGYAFAREASALPIPNSPSHL